MKKEVATLLWMIILEECYMRKSIKMINRITLLLFIGLVFALQSCKPINSYNPYLDQKLPGITPELFAPSIVNTDAIEINTVFNSSFT